MTSHVDFSKITPEQLTQMPPEVLIQIPAGVPPPGVIPNLVNPTNAGNYILIANSVLMLMMFIFLALRFYVVIAIKRKMAADDWMVIAGIIGSCYYFVIVVLGKFNDSDLLVTM
jgi:hypothetical protein